MSRLMPYGRAVLLVFMCLAAACGTGQTLRYAAVVEVPLKPSESGQLSTLLQGIAKRERFFFRDDSAYMKDTTNGQLTVFMTLYRPLQGEKEWPEVQVQADGDHAPWVFFLPPSEERYTQATAQTRRRIIAALRAQWPNLREVPILPHGGVPLQQDVVWTSDGYRIAAERASTYELPLTSRLVAHKVQ
jgi:hypothetical protein